MMVDLNDVLASHWKRFAAVLLDVLSVSVVMVLAMLNEGADRFRSLAQADVVRYPEYFGEQFTLISFSVPFSQSCCLGSG